MGIPKDVVLAFQKVVVPAAVRPSTQPNVPDHRLEIAVVFTFAPATMAALRRASALASSLNARITLVHPQTARYPLPLESPPVLLEFSERRLREIAVECPVETTVQIYLCRDPGRAKGVGGLLAKRRGAKQLRRAGHEVIFTESGKANA